MNILEKDIEELLYEYISYEHIMQERGFYQLQAKYYRQLNLGSYGIADLIGVRITPLNTGNRFLNVTVYELKKDEINTGTLMQAARYVAVLKRILTNQIREGLSIVNVNFDIVLIGRTVDTSSDFVFLSDFIDEVTLYTYHLDFIQGLRFESHEGFFKTKEPNFDYTFFMDDIKTGQWHGKKAN